MCKWILSSLYGLSICQRDIVRVYLCMFILHKITLNYKKLWHIHFHVSAKLCHVCGAKFKGKSPLNEHMYLHHSGHGARYKCSICPKVYMSKAQFSSHFLQHSQVRNCNNSKKEYIIYVIGFQFHSLWAQYHDMELSQCSVELCTSM